MFAVLHNYSPLFNLTINDVYEDMKEFNVDFDDLIIVPCFHFILGPRLGSTGINKMCEGLEYISYSTW